MMKTTLEIFIKNIRSQGRYSFCLEEVREFLNVSDNAAKQVLYRYQKKGEIALVRKGFYVVIPPEHSSRGMLPLNLFIDDMMKWLDKPYYLGLYTAAALHGSSHQQPMESYIITLKPSLRNVRNEKIAINFLTKKQWESSDIEQMKTDAGYINVSTAELTALDLVYYLRYTGISRCADIISDLTDEMEKDKLRETASRYQKTTVIQRLGFLLDLKLNNDLAMPLFNLLSRRKYFYIPLSPYHKKRGEFNSKWKIIMNVDLESDQ